MNFQPRPIWPDTVVSDFHLAEFGDIYFEPGILRHYLVSDICHYGGKYLMVVAQDFQKQMMHFKDVTDKITVNSESASKSSELSE